MILDGKVALIYGGGGAIGGAMARAFVREGAVVFLAGRTEEPLRRIADELRGAGATVDYSLVDALNGADVDRFVDSVVEQTGAIDISANVAGIGDVQRPLLEITVDELLQPVTNAIRTQFLTTRAAARHMVPRGSGVVLAFGGSGPQTEPGLGGFKVALDATEGLRRQWATELGEHGIRVLTMRTGGIAESIPVDMPERDEIVAALTVPTLLNRTATLEDVGNVAAFLVSNLARSMTSTEVNISCGAIVD